MGVEAFALGEFTSNGIFEVTYGDKPLASLDLTFMHEGLSQMKLQAHFDGAKEYQIYHREYPKKAAPAKTAKGLLESLKTVLASPNVASREPLVRFYDHEVQGATRVKPYAGSTQSGPNHSGVLDMAVHGGDANNAVAVSNGLCPQFSYHDTYLMAQKAVDESIRNLIATGVNPERIALVDNFCWPDPLSKKSNPDAYHKMAQLVRACVGLYDAAKTFKAPFVSGKDSMKNDFVGKVKSGDTVKISVPPTVLVTAIGQIPDATKIIPGFFQNVGDQVYLIGTPTESLLASVYSEEFDTTVTGYPEYPDLAANTEFYKKIYQAIQKLWLNSCHDISEGGLMAALSEVCFGNDLGAELNLNSFTWNQLWSETGSQFVVSVPPSQKQMFENHFQGLFKDLGTVTAEKTLTWTFANEKAMGSLQDLKTLWSEGVTNVYHA
jgi:phosphoribosylformylglycinamidine synthase